MAEVPPEELVRCDVRDRVAWLTLDSPANRNALSGRLVGQLLDGLAAADRDDAVRVVLIRAEGGTFCSGADLTEAVGEGMAKAAGMLVSLQRAIAALTKPVVARVHGNVRAGGIGIVAACDIAISTEAASFAFTEVRLGLTPAAISLSVLPRMTDRAAALTFLTGSAFDGVAAAAYGLVTRAVPEERLDEVVGEVCAELVKGNPQGLRETKSLLGRALVERIDREGAELSELSARLFGSAEARAAMAAFVNRRKLTSDGGS
ncbi:MAG: enoyl-CoA hydratase-related protein [Nocardioidaceae bacterium]